MITLEFKPEVHSPASGMIYSHVTTKQWYEIDVLSQQGFAPTVVAMRSRDIMYVVGNGGITTYARVGSNLEAVDFDSIAEPQPHKILISKQGLIAIAATRVYLFACPTFDSISLRAEFAALMGSESFTGGNVFHDTTLVIASRASKRRSIATSASRATTFDRSHSKARACDSSVSSIGIHSRSL
jgi:hypothetical protein